MPSLLVELFDHHTIEKNVYQTFICDCDEVLFLSLKKITEEERLSLKHFLLDQVSHVKQVHFRQISLDKITDDLNLFLTNYDSVTLDVFGGDSILAIFLYQYGLEKQLPIIAIDIEQGKQFKWKMGKVEKEELVIPGLTIEQLMALRGGKLIKSKQPKYSPKQMITIKKLANYAILTEANLIHIDEESSDHISYTFSSPEAQLLCRTKGHILELYLYLLAIESEYFDECMIGAEIDWNGIFPEVDNVQNEIDVVLRKGQSIIFISCKMTDLSVEAINELEVYANHFAGETCLKLIVCSGKINPVYNHRCQEYGVLVIKQDQISNLIPMLQKHIKKHKI